MPSPLKSSHKVRNLARSHATDRQMACWFTIPRAIEAGGKTIVGGIESCTVARDKYNDTLSSLFPNYTGGMIVAADSSLDKRIEIHQSYSDDHNNPSFLMEDGKNPVVFYTEHNAHNYISYKVGSSEHDLTTLGAEQTIDVSSAVWGVSYAQVWRVDSSDGVVCLFRGRTPDTGLLDPVRYWGIAASQDYCQTWPIIERLIDFTDQGYVMSNIQGHDLHIYASMHPARNFGNSIYYMKIDMTNGDIKKADGTVLGSLTGVNLPITYTDMDVVSSLAEPVRTWVKDCGPDGSIVWAEWEDPDADAAVYKHAYYDSGWHVSEIVATGGRFSNKDVINGSVQTYQGGASVDQNGHVFLSRKRPDDMWAIERWTRSGSTWTLAETVAASMTRLVRPYVPHNRVSGPRVTWHRVYEYTSPGLYRARAEWE